jgi:cell division protein FtsB
MNKLDALKVAGIVITIGGILFGAGKSWNRFESQSEDIEELKKRVDGLVKDRDTLILQINHLQWKIEHEHE